MVKVVDPELLVALRRSPAEVDKTKAMMIHLKMTSERRHPDTDEFPRSRNVAACAGQRVQCK